MKMNVYEDSFLLKPKTVKFESEIPDMLSVEVGTTGNRGGDAGNGGSTYFRIENAGCSEMSVDINKDKDGFEVALGGDWELTSIIEALEYTTAVLKFQSTIEEMRSHLININLQSDSKKEVKEQLDYIISKLSHLKESIVLEEPDCLDCEDIWSGTIENKVNNNPVEWKF